MSWNSDTNHIHVSYLGACRWVGMSGLDSIGLVAHAPSSVEDSLMPACPDSVCAYLETRRTGNLYPGSSSAEDANHRLWGTGHSSCLTQQHNETRTGSWGVRSVVPSSGGGIDEAFVKKKHRTVNVFSQQSTISYNWTWKHMGPSPGARIKVLSAQPMGSISIAMILQYLWC